MLRSRPGGQLGRLGVMSREVGQSGDRWLASDGGLSSVVIVEAKPPGRGGVALFGELVEPCLGPAVGEGACPGNRMSRIRSYFFVDNKSVGEMSIADALFTTIRFDSISGRSSLACGVPAVDYEFRAGHVRRLVRGEEHHSRGDLLWSCESIAQRGHGLEGVDGRLGQHVDQGGGVDAAGMDGIDTDALRRVFDGRGLGQEPHSALAGVISRCR